MNLDLTKEEMQILLTLTANNALNGEIEDSLWRKVSNEFARNWDKVAN